MAVEARLLDDVKEGEPVLSIEQGTFVWDLEKVRRRRLFFSSRRVVEVHVVVERHRLRLLRDDCDDFGQTPEQLEKEAKKKEEERKKKEKADAKKKKSGSVHVFFSFTHSAQWHCSACHVVQCS